MGLSLNQFTNKAQEAILAAQKFAEEKQHGKLDPEHLLLTLLSQEGGIVRSILVHAGSDVELLERQVLNHVERQPKTASTGATPTYPSNCRASSSARSARRPPCATNSQARNTC